jgi:4-hydroxy-tetrahydrodipicolinate synthase
MFFETNPITVKTAMALLGMISGELRLPLCPMSDANLNKLKAAMRAYGLIG